jgi:hypothetical protein
VPIKVEPISMRSNTSTWKFIVVSVVSCITWVVIWWFFRFLCQKELSKFFLLEKSIQMLSGIEEHTTDCMNQWYIDTRKQSWTDRVEWPSTFLFAFDNRDHDLWMMIHGCSARAHHRRTKNPV